MIHIHGFVLSFIFKGVAMKHSKTTTIARQRLDRRLVPFKELDASVPRSGWLRAVRDSLDMPARYVAQHLDISENAVYGIERSEKLGTIQLKTLRRAADGLDCDLVYVLVPRRRSLQDIVESAAREKAARDVNAVDKTMALEDQRLDQNETRQRVESYALDLIESGSVWA
jgi:predicted DNA-binding mobile mystery protein A